MTRTMKKRSRKAGLPPGTLVYIGEEREAPVRLTLMGYDATDVVEKTGLSPQKCLPLLEKHKVNWINVDGIHDAGVIQVLGEEFHLHPLVQEDLLNTEQRPKVEDHDSYLFVALKMLYMAGDNGHVESEHISLILCPNALLSFQERQGDVFDSVRERIRSGRGRVRSCGADYLMYTLLDAVVDQYFAILENFGGRLDALESMIYKPGGSSSASLIELHRLKREIVFLRKSIWPLREVVGALSRGDSKHLTEGTLLYLRDVYDHALQVVETVELFREMIAGMIDVHLTTAGNRMNEIMKVLTIMSSLFIPLTFIAGVYGMNFTHMPELDVPWAYPVVWCVMIGVFSGMLLFFRKRGWI